MQADKLWRGEQHTKTLSTCAHLSLHLCIAVASSVGSTGLISREAGRATILIHLDKVERPVQPTRQRRNVHVCSTTANMNQYGSSIRPALDTDLWADMQNYTSTARSFGIGPKVNSLFFRVNIWYFCEDSPSKNSRLPTFVPYCCLVTKLSFSEDFSCTLTP